jgi:hypothetical protein
LAFLCATKQPIHKNHFLQNQDNPRAYRIYPWSHSAFDGIRVGARPPVAGVAAPHERIRITNWSTRRRKSGDCYHLHDQQIDRFIMAADSALGARQPAALDDIASARNQFHQLCAVSCLACSRSVLAGFGFSALRFIVAVSIGLVFVLAFDLDVALDICGGSADEGEAMADAPSGACSAILLDRIHIIARALNQGRPSRLP